MCDQICSIYAIFVLLKFNNDCIVDIVDLQLHVIVKTHNYSQTLPLYQSANCRIHSSIVLFINCKLGNVAARFNNLFLIYYIMTTTMRRRALSAGQVCSFLADIRRGFGLLTACAVQLLVKHFIKEPIRRLIGSLHFISPV